MDNDSKDNLNSVPADLQQNDSVISQTLEEVSPPKFQETSSIQDSPQESPVLTSQDIDNAEASEIVMETSEEKALILPPDEEEIQLAALPPAWAIQLQESLDKLLGDFDYKLKYDTQKNSQIDKLYAENKEYRDKIIDKFKTKIILDVIEQIDDSEKEIARFRDREFSEKNYRALLNAFSYLTEGFRNMLLDHFDIESWQSDVNTPFDPRIQRSLKTIPTDQEEKIKTLESSLRHGYRNTETGQVIRPELVNVFVAQSKKDSVTAIHPGEESLSLDVDTFQDNSATNVHSESDTPHSAAKYSNSLFAAVMAIWKRVKSFRIK